MNNKIGAHAECQLFCNQNNSSFSLLDQSSLEGSHRDFAAPSDKLPIMNIEKKHVLHEDLREYQSLMSMTCFWFGDRNCQSNQLRSRFIELYVKVRWFLCVVLLFIVCVILNFTEDFGLYDGTFVYGPLMLVTSCLITINTYLGKQQFNLTKSLSQQFLAYNEPWMVNIRSTFMTPIKKLVKFTISYNFVTGGVYMFVPLIVDTFLHYAFDSLDDHLLLPMPLSPLYDKKATWGWKFYTITLFNIYSCVEIVLTLAAFISSYGLLTSYFIAELKTFKEKVKSLNLFEASSEVDRQVKEIVIWHNNILLLAKDVKAYFGLPCAFLSQVTSILLTVILFTALTSSNIPVVIMYGLGVGFYVGMALYFNTLGQTVENEGEEIFWALYKLPWYRCEPQRRKTINMMIRQARSPLNIDYHGKTKMNLANFMQVLRSSYSYFTLLRSMTS